MMGKTKKRNVKIKHTIKGDGAYIYYLLYIYIYILLLLFTFDHLINEQCNYKIEYFFFY